jgi:hypothetical protein
MFHSRPVLSTAFNELCERFIKRTTDTHLLIAAHDAAFRVEDVFRALQSDRDVTTIPAPLTISWSAYRQAILEGAPKPLQAAFVYALGINERPDEFELVDGFIRVRHMSRHFSLAKREAVQRLLDATPAGQPVTPCDTANALGIPIWADTQARLTTLHTMELEGDFSAQLRASSIAA